MNFLKIFHKVTAIFLYTAIFSAIKVATLSVYANEPGSPYIQVFFFKDYSFNSKSYSIAQNHQGVIFVGNFNGILEYNGSSWKQHKFSGRPFMAADDEGTVFAGGLNEFGYLAGNKMNQAVFISLTHVFPDSLQPFGQISALKTIGKKVYFTTKSHLLMWNGEVIQVLETFNQTSSKIFVIDSTLISFTPIRGLSFYINGKKIVYRKGDFFQNKYVQDVLPYSGKYLIKTEDEGFFIIGANKVEPFVTPLTEMFQRYGYSTGSIVSNGNFIFGTKRSGLLVMDPSGNLINHIRRDHGLLEDNVSVVYTDHSDNLWVLHNNGLSRVEIPSAISYFDRTTGLRGNVSSIIRHKGVIYFASSQGVFYLAKEEDNLFSRILQVDNIRSNCFSFYALGDFLFVSAENGIFQINEFVGNFLYKGELETAIASEELSRTVFLGLKDGIALIECINGQWTQPVKAPSISNNVLSIAEESDEIIWAATDFNGVYKITRKNPFNESLVEHFADGTGLPEGYTWIVVNRTSSGIIFSTSHGVYRYSHDTGNFYPDTLIGLDFTEGKFWLYPIVEDKFKNLWFNTFYKPDYTSEASASFFSGELEKYRYNSLPLQRKKNFHIKTIYPDENGSIWFGGFNGVLRLDTLIKQKEHEYLFALIDKVTWSSDSIIHYGSNSEIYKNETRRFSLPINSIRFDFATTDYESENNAQFQFRLDGFEKDWSAWSTIDFKEYTNLPGKEYTFNLRVKDLHGEVSEVASFSFKFVPPFYRTWWAYSFYILILMAFVNMFIRHRAMRFARERNKLEKIINTRTEELLKQKEKSEELLANLLPKDTADELKSTGKASSHKYNLVTVLFSDIEGFTKIAEQMNPEILVDELDKFFFKFDSVVEKFNIEKIKTIGDAYMCAGGIPDKNRTNPVEVILAALEMVQYMKQLQQENAKVWDLRIGIHTGPVIAGVVGQKKLSYDIWGDTVNTASRMESSGEPGKINISGSTHELVQDFFACEYRGMMPVKYKGNIDMYFVKGVRPELSEDSKGLDPNSLFFIKLQLLRLQDMEENVFNRLENDLPKNLYFHNLKHTIAVCTNVELLGRAENLTDEEMLIIRTAAVFLDSGYLNEYRRNEDYRCEFARDILPRFNYSEQQSLKICHLLSVSFEKMEPTNKLEKIMFDSYYDFLGRVDLPEAARTLFNEQREYGIAENEKEWMNKFISFIDSHEFYTKTAEKMRDYSKDQQIERLKSVLG